MRISAGQEIEIVAHRGANNLAPENTRSAVARCMDYNVDVIELDVRCSLDGELYNFHDRTLGRTTNGKGRIGFRRSNYIDRLDAGSWFSTEFAGERVPRIRDLIEEFRGKMKFFLDIKSGSIKRIIRIIRETEISKDVFVWFASQRKEQRFRRLAPDIAVKINVADTEELRRKSLSPSTRLIEVPVGSLTTELVQVAHNRGLRVMGVCGNTPDAKDFERLVDMRVDLVNLDSPEDFVAYVNRHAR